MKTTKKGAFNKFASFLLIAVLLICIVGFAASGWQSTQEIEPDSGENGDLADKTDENTDGNNSSEGAPTDGENQNTPQYQIYINTLTGVEITEQESITKPLGFVVDSSSPLYGISSSDITIEFPIENGTTRLLSYTTKTSALWKIGSLAPTRKYISGMSNFFGGAVVSYGNDDLFTYTGAETSRFDVDISKFQDLYFKENSKLIYTGKNMVDSAISRSEIEEISLYKSAPYNFATDVTVVGTTSAKSVILPYQNSKTSLYYSDKTNKYLYYKDDTSKVDMLNGQVISFENVFILFANATTYEQSCGTQTVIDTLGGGSGYYINGGTKTEFNWRVTDSGELIFTSLNGEKLTVNPGNSYIAYYKASCASKVLVS